MSNIKKTLLIGFLIGIVLFVIDLTFHLLSGNTVLLNQNLLIKFGYYQMYSIVLTFVNGYFFDYLNTVSWKKYANYRLAIGIIGGIVLTMLSMFLLRMIQEMAIKGEGFVEFYTEELQNGTFYLISLIITVTASIFFSCSLFL